MNLPFFYEKDIDFSPHALSEESAKHAIQVLRMKEGENLMISDGKGNLYKAFIITINKKNCEVNIETSDKKQEKNIHVTIAISLLKNTSRLEWFLEKATEIGVASIIPLICERTEKQNFRYDRMNNILISAMLQSQQTFLPHLHQPKKIIDFISEEFNGTKLIAHCAEADKNFISQHNHNNKNILILIGPEGDFSKHEVEAALQNNFQPVSLGETRLRSETAGIVAATLLCNIHH